MDEKARTLRGVATLKLLEVAFLAETARKRVLEASERADMLIITAKNESSGVKEYARVVIWYGDKGPTKRWRRWSWPIFG